MTRHFCQTTARNKVHGIEYPESPRSVYLTLGALADMQCMPCAPSKRDRLAMEEQLTAKFLAEEQERQQMQPAPQSPKLANPLHKQDGGARENKQARAGDGVLWAPATVHGESVPGHGGAGSQAAVEDDDEVSAALPSDDDLALLSDDGAQQGARD